MGNALLKRSPPLPGRYLLVLSLLLVLLPHLFRLPAWLAGASIAALVWRLLRDHRNWPLPSTTIRLLITFAGFGTVVLLFHTFLGREPGTALLSVLICLKLLELRTVRDAMMVVFLGYFLAAADFLFDDSMFTGLYMFAAVLSLTAALIVINHPSASLSQTLSYLKRAGSLLVQAVPLMVLLFILFPRINSPLWRIPDDKPPSRTGLSNEMQPGDITNLVDSDELVFRVEFSGAIPDARQLYWRGPVLWNTDGHRWTKLTPQQLRHIGRNALRYEASGKPVRYTIMLEPQKDQWLFALDLPAMLPDIEGGASLLPDFQLLPGKKLPERTRYTMASSLAYQTGELLPWEREYALRLPEAGNPRTRQLAQSWHSETSDDARVVEHALDYFRDQPFFYTRHPPPLGSEPVDDFLFSTRQGFCEHYASAFVTLMRAAGIPARVVTGYQGGDLNAVGKFLEIRQNRAHAWAEVWLTRHGWVRVDPTAVIPPGRVIDSQDSARFQSTAPFSTTAIDSPLLRGSLLKLQQGWNAMNYAWSIWVIGFNEERQRALLEKWGVNRTDWRSLITMLFASLAITLCIVAIIVLYLTPRQKDQVRHLYLHFCRKLNRAGMECPPQEGPYQLAVRATATFPLHAHVINHIVEHYVALRYGRADPGQIKLLRQLISRFDL